MRRSPLKPRTRTSIDLVAPFDGLNTTTPPTLLPPNASPVLNNMKSEKGVLTKRAGFFVDATASSGIPMAVVRFTNSAGTEFVVVITTTKMYNFTGGLTDLTRLSSRITLGYGVLTGTFTNGEVVIQATSGAVGKLIVVDEVNGTNKLYVEWTSGVFDGTHMITGGTSLATATITSVVSEASLGSAVDWTGGESDYVDWTIATVNEGTWLIVTNGKDKPRYWDGVSSKFKNLEDAPGFLYNGFTTCKSVEMFNNHLLLVAPTVSGSLHPFSVVWSETNSAVNFGETTNGVGSTGEAILTEIQRPLLIAVRLGKSLALYTEDSITIVTHVGLPAVFLFETIVPSGIGLSSPRGIIDVGSFHLFVGQDGVYAFQGTNPVEISQKIRDSIRNLIETNYATKYRIFAFYDSHRRRAYFSIPDTANASHLFTCEMDDPSNPRWADQPMSSTFRATTLGLYFYSGAAVPVLLYGINDGRIARGSDTDALYYVSDDFAITDTGIAAEYQTPDLTIPIEYTSVNGYWMELEFEAKVGRVNVYYSVDGGTSWTLINTSPSFTLTTSWAKYRGFVNITSRTIRFSFQAVFNDGKFQLRQVRSWVRPGGPV